MGERIEDIGERDDARVDGDSLSRKLLWVAVAIPPFVVEEGDLFCYAKLRNLASSKHFGPQYRVVAHKLSLSVS